MVQLPAICRKCHLLFPSGLAVYGPGVTFTGNTSKCPLPGCGGIADVMDLQSTDFEETLQKIRAFVISDLQKRQMLALADEAEEKSLSQTEVMEKVDEIAPGASDVIKKMLSSVKAFSQNYLLPAFIRFVLAQAFDACVQTQIDDGPSFRPTEKIEPQIPNELPTMSPAEQKENDIGTADC